MKRKRRERISKLEREKESLKALLETANEFEIEVMEEDIEKLNAEIKEPPEDLEMKNLDLEEEISEKKYVSYHYKRVIKKKNLEYQNTQTPTQVRKRHCRSRGSIQTSRIDEKTIRSHET